MSVLEPLRSDPIERRLLLLAAAFLSFNALALTLAPAVRLHTWDIPWRWQPWAGLGIWLLSFGAVHLALSRRLPERDPFLLPVAALLSGWGIMVIGRLLPLFGLRQALWLALAALVLVVGSRLPPRLVFLRRYKYLWLSGSLLLAGLTLIMGVNPLGYGPTMWLGAYGLYIQPSEPLKLLLVVYLAAYMADRQPYLMLAAVSRSPLARWLTSMVPLLAPTLLMTGLALAVLVVQRDLGAASIYLLLFATIVYAGVGRRRTLAVTGIAVIGAGLLGYTLYDVVRVRVDAWLNPWLDPSGRSYQIVQSLIAFANGGVFGRGPGLGSPGLVPLAHSDLIFAAIGEEYGLLGSLGLLMLLALAAGRGLLVALRAGDHFRRYLAAGLTALWIGQALLIIGGNLRLLPLTGVTLPFVSYGGSSLLTSFLALLLLLLISQPSDPAPARLFQPQPYRHMAAVMFAGLLAVSFLLGWWALYRGPALLGRTDNQRRAVNDLYVLRGALLDRNGQPISSSSGQPGEYARSVLAPDLSSVVGYTDPAYGQAGLEAALDARLRGLEGHSQATVLLDRLLYAQSPPGLDVRLTLDLELQRHADDMLRGQRGALVLLEARSGQILALASHPTFDANRLGEQWNQLVADPDAPLLNRAVLGRYPLGDLESQLFSAGLAPLESDPLLLDLIPGGLFAQAPAANNSTILDGYSPLHLALVAAAITDGGLRPAPQIVLALELPNGEWQSQLPSREPLPVFSAAAAGDLLQRNTDGPDRWQVISLIAPGTDDAAVWYIAGTQSQASGSLYALALILENADAALAEAIGRAVLAAAGERR